jgi:hypothetical protein
MHIALRFAAFAIKCATNGVLILFLVFAFYAAAYIGESTGWFRVEDQMCMECG